jgi:hypothetical protein
VAGAGARHLHRHLGELLVGGGGPVDVSLELGQEALRLPDAHRRHHGVLRAVPPVQRRRRHAAAPGDLVHRGSADPEVQQGIEGTVEDLLVGLARGRALGSQRLEHEIGRRMDSHGG